MVKELTFLIPAMLTGVLMGYSMDLWMEGAERGGAELRQAKRDLISSAGLFELHHRVYNRVGERAWEAQVKPEFLSRITLATVRDTGILLPEPSDVVRWVRAHPEQARGMLEAAAFRVRP